MKVLWRSYEGLKRSLMTLVKEEMENNVFILCFSNLTMFLEIMENKSKQNYESNQLISLTRRKYCHISSYCTPYYLWITMVLLTIFAQRSLLKIYKIMTAHCMIRFNDYSWCYYANKLPGVSYIYWNE